MTIKATAYKSTEQDNRDIATAKAAIEAEKYVTTQREVDNEASAKDKAQALVNALGESLAGTTATVVDGNFIAAIAGKEPFAIGTDGSYTFTVTISKGMGTPVTLSQKMTITATALAPLFLGITSEDDASADGTTRIIAPSGLPTGQYYSYKISEDENAVPRPYVGDAWSGGTAFGNGNNEVSFEVENGKHIGVAIVDSEGKVVAFTDVVAVAYRQVKPTAKIADWADGGNYFGTTAGTASRNDSVSQPDFSFTGDGTWKTSNEVAIQLADEPAKKYKPTEQNTTVTLKGADFDTTFKWETKDDINVSGWYFGTGYKPSLPDSWDVNSNQNSEDSYAKSEVLYAPQTSVAFENANALSFEHKTAKVVINICNNRVAGNNVTEAKLKNVYLTADFNNGSVTAKENISDINMLEISNIEVLFPGSVKVTAIASYQAMVIPQDLGSDAAVAITLQGFDKPFTCNLTGTWESGKVYTYNITLEDVEITKLEAVYNTGYDDGQINLEYGNSEDRVKEILGEKIKEVKATCDKKDEPLVISKDNVIWEALDIYYPGRAGEYIFKAKPEIPAGYKLADGVSETVAQVTVKINGYVIVP